MAIVNRISFFDLTNEMEARIKENHIAKVMMHIRQRKLEVAPPPTAANDSYQIDDVRVEKDNTIRTYLLNEKEPVRFYTPQDIVDLVTVYKNIFSQLLRGGILGLVIIILGRKIWPLWLEKVFNIYPLVIKEEYWSQPVKEMRRVLTGKIDLTILNAICVVLENDMAYRYRFQDILAEINKDAFNKYPIREIRRLIDVLMAREVNTTDDTGIKWMNKKWEKVKILALFLLFKPGFIRELKSIVNNLNVEEVKLSREDIYWTDNVPNYNYRGKSFEERMAEYKILKSVA